MSRVTFEVFETFRREVILPNLIVLSIHIYWSDGTKSKITSSSSTISRLPKLKRLELRGKTKEDGWPLVEEFIIACGPTIQELVFGISTSNFEQKFPNYWEVMSKIIDKIPALTTYGTDQLGFGGHRPSTTIKIPFSTLIITNILNALGGTFDTEFEPVVTLLGSQISWSTRHGKT